MTDHDSEKIVIDLDQILEVALLGARRTSVFLGLGVNAARDPNLVNIHLPHILNLTGIPPAPDDKTIATMKREFEAWIVGAGLRDLLGAFSVFLDRTFDALVLSTEGGASDLASLPSSVRKFAGKSIPEKLEALGTAHGFSTPVANTFPGLRNARNCLTHRMGKVGPQDLSGSDRLTVQWAALDVFGRLENGQVEQIPPDQDSPFGFSDAAKVELRSVRRERSFSLGTQIQFSPRELSEIVWTVTTAAHDIRNATVAWATAAGKVSKKPGTAMAVSVTTEPGGEP